MIIPPWTAADSHWLVEQIERFLDVEPDQPGNRLNDCGVDSQGRVWLGTMENNMDRDNSSRSIGKKGSLYCLSEGDLIRHDAVVRHRGRSHRTPRPGRPVSAKRQGDGCSLPDLVRTQRGTLRLTKGRVLVAFGSV